MNDPDLQRWLLADDGLATRLRALRGTTPGNAFAATAGMRASKLSKLELAQQTPTAEDIQAIVSAAGQPTAVADDLIAKLATAPAVKASARANRFGQVATQKRLNRLLAEATSVRLYDDTYVPRLAQTLEYATAVLAAAASTRGVRNEAREAANIIHTFALYPALLNDRNYQMVITESVLYWQPLPAASMKHQFEWLLAVADQANVDLRVIPLGQPGIVLPPTSFGILGNTGFVDTLDGADTLTGARLAGHTALIDELAAAAVRGPDALTLIRDAIVRTQNVAPVRFQAGTHA